MKTCFTERGWCIIKGVIPKPHRITRSVIKEVTECVFRKEEEIKAIEKLTAKGIDPLNLLTDMALREKYLPNPKCIWYNNNIRTPIVAKSNGIANIYFNKRVRDKVLFNPDVYNAINCLYKTFSDEDVIHLYGPERVCVKAQGSTDMPRHIDCDLLLQSASNKKIIPSAATHPETMFRIQSIGCLQIDSKEKHNGRTEVLAGYHKYFKLGALYFKDCIKASEAVSGRNFFPIVVQEVFAKHLDTFKEYITEFYDKKGKLLPFEKTPLANTKTSKKKSKKEKKDNTLSPRAVYDSLPKKIVEIEYTQPVVEDGDILCFDQRLPHRNTKNKSSIARVACFISLYPNSYLQKDDISPCDIFEGNVCKMRKFNVNDLERDYYEDVWEERVSFKKSSIIRKMLGLPLKK